MWVCTVLRVSLLGLFKGMIKVYMGLYCSEGTLVGVVQREPKGELTFLHWGKEGFKSKVQVWYPGHTPPRCFRVFGGISLIRRATGGGAHLVVVP